jgi:hypothetical protein
VEGKATWKKRKNNKADNKQAATTMNNILAIKNSGWGKNAHQLRMNTPSTKKTWAEVIKSRGINVQIVLGNGNLRLIILTKVRGERWGGAAQRLMKKGEDGERGVMRRGKGGLEATISRGNKGGKMGKHGRGTHYHLA